MESYLYRGDTVDRLRRMPPDRFFRGWLNMETDGPCSHPGLNHLKREAAAHGAQHFRIAFWENVPTALARYPFGALPSALLRFRAEDLYDRGFRLSPDEHTGPGGLIASVIDRATPSDSFAGKLSCTGIPLEAVDVLCPDMEWRSLDASGILDDRDIGASALRFDIRFPEGTARGHAWSFEHLQVVYVRQHWTGGCYLTLDESRALTAAMEVSRALDLRHPDQQRWIFEVEGTEPARTAYEARLACGARSVRQRLSGEAAKYSLEFSKQLRGERAAWLEDLGQTAITSGQWRWLHPIIKAACELGFRGVTQSP